MTRRSYFFLDGVQVWWVPCRSVGERRLAYPSPALVHNRRSIAQSEQQDDFCTDDRGVTLTANDASLIENEEIPKKERSLRDQDLDRIEVDPELR